MRVAVLAGLMSAAMALSACYEVQGPVVTQGVRAAGIADGTWRRDDGTEVSIRWNEAEAAYRIGAGGAVRLAAVGPSLYLADYQAERRIVLLVTASENELVFRLPPDEAERMLAVGSGASIKAGPIKLLGGDPKAVSAYLTAMAARPDLVEAGRLTRISR
jgi:hypothetical protein